MESSPSNYNPIIIYSPSCYFWFLLVHSFYCNSTKGHLFNLQSSSSIWQWEPLPTIHLYSSTVRPSSTAFLIPTVQTQIHLWSFTVELRSALYGCRDTLVSSSLSYELWPLTWFWPGGIKCPSGENQYLWSRFPSPLQSKQVRGFDVWRSQQPVDELWLQQRPTF